VANLIITVIAIALVAVASFMGAYYGGSAYLNDSALANASSVLNDAIQLSAAWNAYLGDNNDTIPTSLSLLVQPVNTVANGGYLQSIPIDPPEPGGVGAFPVFVASDATGSTYYAYFDLGRVASGKTAGINDTNASACIRIQKTALGKQPTVIDTKPQGQIASTGNSVFGCSILSGSISNGLGGATVPTGDLQTGDYVVEYKLE
jgi:hypothetical protein